MSIPAQRVLHVNLNCSDQLRTRDMLIPLGFEPASRLFTEPQDGADMGIDGQVQWDGFAMISSAAWDNAMVDLLKFCLPPASGKAYPELDHVGYGRLLIAIENPVTAQSLLKLDPGVQFVSDLDEGSDPSTVFSFRDVDGVWYDVMEANKAQGIAVGLAGVVANCTSLDTTRQWYTDAIGLQPVNESSHTLAAQRYQLAQPMTVQNCDLRLPGRPDFTVRLQQADSVHGSVYPAPNHIGLYRMALAVDDIQMCYRQLLAAGVNCPRPPVYQDMGEEIPVDGVWALYFYDPDGICVELIQNPDVNA